MKKEEAIASALELAKKQNLEPRFDSTEGLRFMAFPFVARYIDKFLPCPHYVAIDAIVACLSSESPLVAVSALVQAAEVSGALGSGNAYEELILACRNRVIEMVGSVRI